jgi:hypothetical protein
VGFAAQGGQAICDLDCTGRALQEILVGLVDEIGILRDGVSAQRGAGAQQSAYYRKQKGRSFSHVLVSPWRHKIQRLDLPLVTATLRHVGVDGMPRAMLRRG